MTPFAPQSPSSAPFTFRAIPATQMMNGTGGSGPAAPSPLASTAAKPGKTSHYYFTGPDGKRYRMWYQTTERQPGENPKVYTHETTVDNWEKIASVVSPHLKGSATFKPAFEGQQLKGFNPTASPLLRLDADKEIANAFKDLERTRASTPALSPSFSSPKPLASKLVSTPSTSSFSAASPSQESVPSQIAPLVTALRSNAPLSESQILDSLSKIDPTATHITKRDGSFYTLEELCKEGPALNGEKIIIPLKIPQSTSSPVHALLAIGSPKPREYLRKGNRRDVIFYSPTGRKLQSQEETQIRQYLKTRMIIDRFEKAESSLPGNNSGVAILAFCANGFDCGNVADPKNANGISSPDFRSRFANRIIEKCEQDSHQSTQQRRRAESETDSDDSTASPTPPSLLPRSSISQLRPTRSFLSSGQELNEDEDSETLFEAPRSPVETEPNTEESTSSASSFHSIDSPEPTALEVPASPVQTGGDTEESTGPALSFHSIGSPASLASAAANASKSFPTAHDIATLPANELASRFSMDDLLTLSGNPDHFSQNAQAGAPPAARIPGQQIEKSA